MKQFTKLLFLGLIVLLPISGGWLGIMVQDLSPRVAARYGIRVNEGVLVTRVQFNSPAAAGGILEGDVIRAVNQQKILNSKTLKEVVSGFSPEVAITILVIRNHRELTLRFKLGSTPRSAV